MLATVPARLALSPVLLVQALQVRRRALILPEPSGPRCGVAGRGPVLRVLIAGDSSAAGVGVSTQAQALSGQLVAALSTDFTVHWQLEAKSGATTAQTLARLRALDAGPFDVGPFDVAVTALGVNDVTRQVPLRRWLANQAQITALLTSRFGVRAQWRSGVPPLAQFPLLPRPLRDVVGAQARNFDAALQRASTGPTRHLPFDATQLRPDMMARDGFHPGAPIYAAWGAALAREIRAQFA